eukprot:gene3623-2560_t
MRYREARRPVAEKNAAEMVEHKFRHRQKKKRGKGGEAPTTNGHLYHSPDLPLATAAEKEIALYPLSPSPRRVCLSLGCRTLPSVCMGRTHGQVSRSIFSVTFSNQSNNEKKTTVCSSLRYTVPRLIYNGAGTGREYEAIQQQLYQWMTTKSIGGFYNLRIRSSPLSSLATASAPPRVVLSFVSPYVRYGLLLLYVFEGIIVSKIYIYIQSLKSVDSIGVSNLCWVHRFIP